MGFYSKRSATQTIRPCAPLSDHPPAGERLSRLPGVGSSTPRALVLANDGPLGPLFRPGVAGAAIFERLTQYKLSALAPLTWDYLRLMSTPNHRRHFGASAPRSPHVRDMRVRGLRLMMVGVSAAMAPPPSAIGVVVRPSSMGSTYGGNRCEFPGGGGHRRRIIVHVTLYLQSRVAGPRSSGGTRR